MSDRYPLSEDQQYKLTVIISALVACVIITIATLVAVSSENAGQRRATLQIVCIKAGGNWNDARVECVSPLPIPVRPSV